jgi:tripartite-type tricarboxylate transporter receptor subunit TctC
MGYSVVAPVNYGLLAPKGAPREVIDKIQSAAQKVMENHGAYVKDRLDQFGAQVDFMATREYSTFLRNQYDYYGRMVRSLKQ